MFGTPVPENLTDLIVLTNLFLPLFFCTDCTGYLDEIGVLRSFFFDVQEGLTPYGTYFFHGLYFIIQISSMKLSIFCTDYT